MKILFIILALLSFLGIVCDGDKIVKRYMMMIFAMCFLALVILALL